MLLHKSIYLFQTANMSDCCLFVVFLPCLNEVQISSKMALKRLTISLSSGKGGEKAFSVVKSKCVCPPTPLVNLDRASL